jgi:hypothetical protein
MLGFAVSRPVQALDLRVGSVSASAHDGNVPGNTVDNRLDTRWSADGDGQWIRYDAGKILPLLGVKMAFFRGTERIAYFDIETSADGRSWRLIRSGQSNGRTNELQLFSFTRVDARYVRIVGHGNTTNAWNSVTEVRLVTTDPVTGSSVSPVWAENFERIAAGTHWYNQAYLEVRSGCGVGGNRCVRASYAPSVTGSPVIFFKQAIPHAREYTLNYDLMFESDFEWVRGGKLPGLSPDSPTSGCHAAEPAGWSARVMWRRDGVPELYTYDQNRSSSCGTDNFATGFVFERGRYRALSLHVRLNEPAAQANGLVELYIDGKRVASKQNVQLRRIGGTSSEITQFLFSSFFGGDDATWAPSRVVHARFDNFAVYPGLRIRSQPGQ